MQDVFIAGRSSVTDALSLVDEYGPDAPLAAAMRAVQSRDAGNVLKFCHWRQIERLSALLASNNVQGSLHEHSSRTGAVKARWLGLARWSLVE